MEKITKKYFKDVYDYVTKQNESYTFDLHELEKNLENYKNKFSADSADLDVYILPGGTDKSNNRTDFLGFLAYDKDVKYYFGTANSVPSQYIIYPHYDEKNEKTIYSLREKECDKNTKEYDNNEIATKLFNDKIKPKLKILFDENFQIGRKKEDRVLKGSVNSISWDELQKFLDYHSAPQLIRRAILLIRSVLYGDKNFVFISDDKIADIYDAMSLEPVPDNMTETQKWLYMNQSIMKQCFEWSGEKELTDSFQKKISVILWKMCIYKNMLNPNSPNLIYYGAPGTGKTHSVEEMIKYLTLGDTEERSCFVQCHPGFGYEDFMEGIRPVGITKDEKIKLDVVNGVFKKLCIEAIKNIDKNIDYFFVADEINRANLSEMFGETLSLLEASYRCKKKDDNEHMRKTPMCKTIETVALEKLKKGESKETVDKYLDAMTVWHKIEVDESKENPYSVKVLFGIPKNIYFIGMMNDVDKSIDSFDLALRRRFKWVRMDCDYDVIENALSITLNKNELETYIKKCKALNTFISNKDNESLGLGKAFEFGHSYYMKLKDYYESNLEESCKKLFDEHLRPVLREYIRSYIGELKIEEKLDEAGKKFVDESYKYESTTITSDVLWKELDNSKNLILYGPPGTGKTYLVDEMLKKHNILKEQYIKIQCHPGFGYEEYMEGIKPVGFTKDGAVRFEVLNGYFKELCIEAKKDTNHTNKYFFIADEINRANLSSMFGETLSLLETDYRYKLDEPESEDNKLHLRETPLSPVICSYINSTKDVNIEKLAFDYKKDEKNNTISSVNFGVPDNVYFIGMMNDVDRSIDSFDLALRRRFVWLRFDYSEKSLENILFEEKPNLKNDEIQKYVDECNKLNKKICDDLGKTCEIGHAIFGKITNYVKKNTITKDYKSTFFDENLESTLKEYYRTYKSIDETEIEKWLKNLKTLFTE